MDKDLIIVNFSEMLKELISEKNLTFKQFAIDIGVSESTVFRWIKNPLQINRPNLIKIADYFECLIEYILGRSKNDIQIVPKSCPHFTDRVRMIMKEQNISTYTLEKTSKFKCSYFTQWNKGNEPALQTLLELADFFNCTIDYLVGRET